MGKCLLCARTVAKRTLGKVKMDPKRQTSQCRSEHPQDLGLPTGGEMAPPPLAPPSEVKHRIKHSAGTLQCAQGRQSQDEGETSTESTTTYQTPTVCQVCGCEPHSQTTQLETQRKAKAVNSSCTICLLPLGCELPEGRDCSLGLPVSPAPSSGPSTEQGLSAS